VILGRLIDDSSVRFGMEGSVPPAPRVESPLLSLVMSRLNERRRQRALGVIDLELLGDATGGNRETALRNILRGFYQACIIDLDPSIRGFVEEDLLTDSGFRDSLAVETAEKKSRVRAA
jgi:hypothetical protein